MTPSLPRESIPGWMHFRLIQSANVKIVLYRQVTGYAYSKGLWLDSSVESMVTRVEHIVARPLLVASLLQKNMSQYLF